MATLVTNLSKPSLVQPSHLPDQTKPWQIWARLDTIVKQATQSHPTTGKLFKARNLEFLLTDSSKFQSGELDCHHNQTGQPPTNQNAQNDSKYIFRPWSQLLTPPPLAGWREGGMGKNSIGLKWLQMHSRPWFSLLSNDRPTPLKYQKKWFFYNEVLLKDIVSLTLTLGWKNEKQPSVLTELDLKACNLLKLFLLIIFLLTSFPVHWSKCILNIAIIMSRSCFRVKLIFGA